MGTIVKDSQGNTVVTGDNELATRKFVVDNAAPPISGYLTLNPLAELRTLDPNSASIVSDLVRIVQTMVNDLQRGGAMDVLAPTIPSMSAASSITTASVTWNWNAATDNSGAVVGYDLQIATDAAFTLNLRTINLGNVLTYFDSGRSSSTTYYARVRAKDAAGNTTAYSSSVNATTNAIVTIMDIGAFTTPVGAYAVSRLLKSGYSGPAIRVEKADTTQVDLPTDFTKAYADAIETGLKVRKIYDQSGQGLHLTGTGSKPLLKFDANNLPYIEVLEAGSTVFASATNVTVNNPKYICVINGQHSGGNNNLAGIGPGYFTLQFYSGDLMLNRISAVHYSNVNGLQQLCAFYQTGNESVWRNGTLLTPTSGADSGDYPYTEPLQLFNQYGGQTFNGSFYEMIVVDDSSVANRVAVQSNQISYYGVV